MSEYEPKNTPMHIFVSAINFDYSSQILHQVHVAELDRSRPGDGINLRLPTITTGPVNAALSLELYFKCVLLIETGKIPFDHKLASLYSKISPTFQSRISSIFKSDDHFREIVAQFPSEQSEFEIEAILRDANNAFIELRYEYECAMSTTRFLIWPVSQATRRAILEIRPSWAKALEWALKPPSIGPIY